MALFDLVRCFQDVNNWMFPRVIVLFLGRSPDGFRSPTVDQGRFHLAGNRNPQVVFDGCA